MAKDDKKAAAKKAAPAKTAKEKAKFGVAELAKAMGVEAATARIALRKNGIKKTPGGHYGWESKEELSSLAEKLKTAPAAKKEKGSAEKKPAKKKKADA